MVVTRRFAQIACAVNLCCLTFVLHAAEPNVSQSRLTATPAAKEMGRLGGNFLVSGQKASWSPDGTKLVFCLPAKLNESNSRQGLSILDLTSREITKLTDKGRDPAWSPGDGKWIAFEKGTGNERSVWLIEVDAGNSTRLCKGAYPRWNRDGKTLYFYSPVSKALMQIVVGNTPAEPTKIMDIAAPTPAVSPDGKKIAYRSGDWLYAVDRESGKQIGKYVFPGGTGFFADFSPNGKYLAFSGTSSVGAGGLWVLNQATGEATRLTTGPLSLPAWSPDGSKLAFVMITGSVSEVWMIAAKSLESAELSRVSIRPLVPPVGTDLEEMAKFMQTMDQRKAATQAEYQRQSQALMADYRHQSKIIDVAIKEAAAKILELDKERQSTAYGRAFQVMLPIRIGAFPTMTEPNQQAFLTEFKKFLASKAPDEINASDVVMAARIGSALAASGREAFAVDVYRDFSSILSKSSNRSINMYRQKYLDAAAKKLAIIGTSMKLAGTTVRGQKAFDWETYRGKLVLVDFWATWCAPCRAELPNMKRCYQAYNDAGFEIVGVSLDRDRNALENYLKEQQVPWTTLHEKEGGGKHPIATYYGITSIPAMFLVDRAGKITSTNARSTRLISLLAERLGAPFELAQQAAESDDWEKAAALTQLAASLSPSINTLLALGTSQLVAGDKNGYETTCRTTIARYGRHENEFVRSKVMHLCTLANNSILQQNTVSEISDSLPAASKNGALCLSRGMLCYRQGNFEKALEVLPTEGDVIRVPLALLFRAMSNYQLGNRDEANKLLRAARIEIANRIPSIKGEALPDYAPARWAAWGMIDLVRRETEALLSGSIAGSEEKLLHLIAAREYAKAVEEISRLVKQSPQDMDLRLRRVGLAVRAENWKIAADDLIILANDQPKDSIRWLRAAVVLAMAGDKERHAHFCQAMLATFADSNEIGSVEQATKASLLIPNSIALQKLPLEKLLQTLQDKRTDPVLLPWGWATCALAEYRRGNLDGVIQYVKRAEAEPRYATNVRVQTMCLFLKAIVLNSENKPDQSRNVYESGLALLRQRQAENTAKGTWHHDDLISQILQHEADAALK